MEDARSPACVCTHFDEHATCCTYTDSMCEKICQKMRNAGCTGVTKDKKRPLCLRFHVRCTAVLMQCESSKAKKKGNSVKYRHIFVIMQVVWREVHLPYHAYAKKIIRVTSEELMNNLACKRQCTRNSACIHLTFVHLAGCYNFSWCFEEQ